MVATDSRGCASARGCGRLLGNYDLGFVLQFLKAAVGNYISRIDAFDGGLARVGDAWFDVADLRRILLDQVDKCVLAVMLNRRTRNQRDPLQRLHQEPGVYELVGKQRFVLVIE